MTVTALPKILFLENRSITDIWSGVAKLIQSDFDCQLLRFNRAFGSKFPGKIVDLVISPQLDNSTDSSINDFIKMVCQTDRAIYLHGATESDIRDAILSVFAILKQLEFRVVIGEVTSVYERAVEFYCRNNGIIFLAPMTARIPADRFFFLDGSAIFPLPIAAMQDEQSELINSANTARQNAGKNDLAIVVDRYVRFQNTLRTLIGWLIGERLHTPSPLRKILINKQQKNAIFQINNTILAGIEHVNRTAVIYCMHVQPESTLDTYSPNFWDQASIISIIAEACRAANRPFFVRPHPRGKYECVLHLLKIKAEGISILSPQVSMQSLLKRLPMIVTVSGTVLLEAAAAGAPTVALDRSYIATFPGVLQASPSSFYKVLSGEISTITASPELQKEWFDSINAFSHKGLISPPEWSSQALSDKNLLDIANATRIAINWCLEKNKIGTNEIDSIQCLKLKMHNTQSLSYKVASLKYLSPSYVLIVSALIFFVTLTILPVDVKIPLSNEAMFFWAICFFSFLAGTVLGSGEKSYLQIKTYPSNQKIIINILKFIVVLGLIGSVLLLMDRYGMRGVSLDSDAMESREVLSESSPSVWSMISVIGYSIGIVSYMMIWVAELRCIKISLWIKALALLNILIVLFVNIQLGSRSLLLVVLISYLLAWFFTLSAKAERLKACHVMVTLVLITLMVLVSSSLMVMRVELMGRSMLDSILISNYAEIIEPSQFILDLLQNENSLTVFVAGVFSLLQYIFHGIYEFSLLFTSFSGEHEMGNRTFWLPLKVLSIFTNGGQSQEIFDNSGVKEGVYTTYAGPIFIDFGLLSPIILFVNGILISLPYRWLMLGKLAWLPATALAVTGTILWPVVNIFESSSGAFLLFGSIIIGLLGELFRLNVNGLDGVQVK